MWLWRLVRCFDGSVRFVINLSFHYLDYEWQAVRRNIQYLQVKHSKRGRSSEACGWWSFFDFSFLMMFGFVQDTIVCLMIRYCSVFDESIHFLWMRDAGECKWGWAQNRYGKPLSIRQAVNHSHLDIHHIQMYENNILLTKTQKPKISVIKTKFLRFDSIRGVSLDFITNFEGNLCLSHHAMDVPHQRYLIKKYLLLLFEIVFPIVLGILTL